MDAILAEDELESLLTCTKMLMNHVHVVQQSFNLLPPKDHYGTCINYIDLEPESMFPRFIEMGAYLPMTRRLIELNIPRKTAIYLNRNFDIPESDNKQELIRHVRVIRNRLPYWYRIQLKTL